MIRQVREDVRYNRKPAVTTLPGSIAGKQSSKLAKVRYFVDG
jgi:hypothetical protein